MLQASRIVSTSEMKLAEQNANEGGIPYLRLMENAGSAAYRVIRDHIGLEGKRFVVLCGTGNNGGDGFVVARKLLEQNRITTVIITGLPRTNDARAMYDTLTALEVEILMLGVDADEMISDRINHCEVIVDAVFGTGFHGALPERVAGMFRMANQAKACKLSLDMPSGVNSDNGEMDQDAFCPEITVAFAAMKLAHILPQSRRFCGEVHTVHIGMEEDCFANMGFLLTVLDENVIDAALPVRKPDSHKGNYGRLLNIAGSKNMPGAAVISTLAALRSGAGIVTLASTDMVADIAASHFCEATFLRCKADFNGQISMDSIRELAMMLLKSSACLIGCGIGVSENTITILRTVLENSTSPIIIDADGINCLSRDINIIRTAKVPVILTPHMGEMSRLTKKTVPEIKEDAFRIARDFAKQWNVILVLKDASTIIALPTGELYLNTTGNPGMARGGSGDMLAGMIAAFAAQGIEPSLAAAAAVYLHGLCGDKTAEKRSQYGMLPSDMIAELPLLFQSMNR